MDSTGSVTGHIQAFPFKPNQFSKPVAVHINDIDIAWYLRPSDFKRSGQMTPLEQHFAVEEASHAFLSLSEGLKVNWINHRRDVHRLDNSKFYQQVLAARAGLQVPATLISNQAQAFSDFFGEQERCLVKSMGLSQIVADKPKYIYSNVVAVNEIASASSSLQHCPVFSQEYIEKRYEYRVVMANPVCISCRIDSQASEKSKVDWRRYDFDNVEHVEAAIPDNLINKLWDFMNLANLKFGMIDLIETSKGDFVFLEVNPSGQWGWLQQIAGIDVPTAISSMLMTHANG